ncbi:coproporphyrinogen III oxidase [Shewanella sp. Choline-02u-19]|jgi:coproporphyrinogen III oxidase-like Fe-S oxidoreductase|uniref:coproporphyrinogen III oxidase family protein n=1 Tax=unclassified Shewanella TaxID=196818 RepID=UPI000C34D75B|nr:MULTISPECIES: coproporphyrinogen III oxidase family protein [unclassified Shewanella]PKG55140.1 coproporphyrinogen III oxidase [Shewanella sp. GutDb-MelDb]PKG72899.1 coproporphyrinogen III oxidase [Shewanella sp. GutCb]PKH58221.1 coproporphyrinogen III oxidase [Shewanella sp. Bg11-22]PKI29516.1 coproporphyrinogen III oxidase [Shewanella sp. Choline-02u-19]
MSSIILPDSAQPYKANITTPDWMISSMEKVMQFYVDRNLRLDTVSAEMMPNPIEGKKYMLYAHVPFCHTLCSYCTFHRFLFNEDKARSYFISLRKEMDMVKNLGYDFESMYIGGGTTTVLEDELARTIEHAKKLFPSIKEVSCESDPQHLDRPGFKQLEGLVDRMSIGVQSFNDDILTMTDRIDKFGTGQQTFDKIMAAKELFPIINVDLIFGFRGQTDEVIQNDLDMAAKLDPRQITTYPLMITHQTRKSVKGKLAAPQGDMVRQYRQILNSLNGQYNQLSAWAFGKTDNEGFDEYVIDYDEYLGVGSGSFSFLDDTLYVNTFSLKKYQQRIGSGHMGVEQQKNYGRKEVMQYRFLLGMFSGRLSRKYFRETFGVNLDTALFKEMTSMKAIGAIKNDPMDRDNLIVTDNGKMMGLLMMKEFYSGMDNVRAQLRKPLKESDM